MPLRCPLVALPPGGCATSRCSRSCTVFLNLVLTVGFSECSFSFPLSAIRVCYPVLYNVLPATGARRLSTRSHLPWPQCHRLSKEQDALSSVFIPEAANFISVWSNCYLERPLTPANQHRQTRSCAARHATKLNESPSRRLLQTMRAKTDQIFGLFWEPSHKSMAQPAGASSQPSSIRFSAVGDADDCTDKVYEPTIIPRFP